MNRKAIFFVIVAVIAVTYGIICATNSRFTYSVEAKGNIQLLQTKCSLELYNPTSVTGSTSGSGYKTKNGTSYFAVPSIPTDYTNINYKINNKVGGEINQKDVQYYIRVVAEDGSTNMPIEYNVHAYNNASSKYSLVSGWGYGPFTLQKDTEYSGTNRLFSIEANYTSIDKKYSTSVQKMKVQMVTKLSSGSLKVLSEAPLYVKYTGPAILDNAPITVNYYNYGTDSNKVGTTQSLSIPVGTKIDFTNSTQLNSLGFSMPSGFNLHDVRGDLVTSTSQNVTSVQIPNLVVQGNSYTINVFMTFIRNFDYKGSEQTFVAPIAGKYKLEVWGAQGGRISSDLPEGGYGGYSVGEAPLYQGQTLYIYVGGAGYYDTSKELGGSGYNGGENGAFKITTETIQGGAGGGGATHIATEELGILSSFENNKGTVLIVAGGGGGSGSFKGGSGGGCIRK